MIARSRCARLIGWVLALGAIILPAGPARAASRAGVTPAQQEEGHGLMEPVVYGALVQIAELLVK